MYTSRVLKQYYLGCLAHASYLIASTTSGVAAVVDPQRDIEPYLADARELGVTIAYVILTHFHADFVAGHIELRNHAGARIALGRQAEAEYDFLPLREGDVLALGDLRLGVLETPGHTPEGVCLLVYEPGDAPGRPSAVLTGDTLFIGDVGRPDLMASQGVTAEELAGALYDSLHTKLLPLPDETLVYPAHGAGSLCGRSLSSETVSTMGVQRRYNYALQPMSRDEFIGLMTTDQPEAPSYFSYDAQLNRMERPTLDVALDRELRPLSLDEALRRADSGAMLLDVRDPGDFAAAHLAGSINVGLGGQFAPWAGALLDRQRPIVVIAPPGGEVDAAIRLGRIGFDLVEGYLEGGMAALETRPDLIERFDRLAPATLAERLAEPLPPLVVDVRDEPERRLGALAGSVGMPLRHLEERHAELPRDRDIVVHCAGGYRSAIAASILRRHGFRRVTDLAGGYSAWSSTIDVNAS